MYYGYLRAILGTNMVVLYSILLRMIVTLLTVLLKHTVLNCVKRWLSEKMALWDLDNEQ